MRSPNEKKMFDLLLDEIEDTLQDIEQRCLKLEGSDQAKELQIIFRAAHNVKGASQLYGLNDLGAFVHGFEDLLTTLQKAGKPVTQASVDLLLRAQEFIKSWVMSLRENEKFIPDIAPAKAEILRHIEDLKAGRIAADTPVAAPAPTEPTPATTANAVAKPTPDGTKPAEASAVTPEKTSPKEAASPADTRNQKAKRSASTLRIPSQKIDEIMQFIGELSIQQGILWHNMQQNTFNVLTCKNAVGLNQKTLKALYELVITLRMQSAETLFQRIERNARDLAREQNKKLQIQLKGADIPLDKTVIELITDPMMHLVRNAIDHGVEDTKTRTDAGKPETAVLSIETHQETGHVVISITDDGRGLDPQMILEKAVKRGLVRPEQKLTDAEAIQLIFLPGFSTRDMVTEISGRGVGMDIVQKAIEQLGGRIDIHSKKGKGTTFQIFLPASLEIIEGLMVRVGEHLYMIPRQDVVEILDLDEFDVENIGIGGRAIRLRKTVVPLEDMADYIGVENRRESAPKNQDSGSRTALLIRLADRTHLGLKVDAVLSQQQIVVRPLNDILSKVPGFTGMTILGNGEPSMILSIASIGEAYLRWTKRSHKQKPSNSFGESA